jgi:methionyl aminopeptidase
MKIARMPIMKFIMIKSERQLEGIRKSCKLAAATLKFIEPHVVPGRTTAELDKLMADFIRDHGAHAATLGYKGACPKQPPYPKSSCTSINEVVCHGIPNNTELKEGDIVGIDVTTILNGYYGDTAKTFPVGKISIDAELLLEVTKKCLELGIKQVKPGAMTGEIGHSIYSYAILQGCTVVEAFCGHGVGIEFHEPPQICHVSDKKDGVPMFVGMTFTIEPMICLGSPDVEIDESDGWTVRTKDRLLSAQFEHTVLVVPDGHEILTV